MQMVGLLAHLSVPVVNFPKFSIGYDLCINFIFLFCLIFAKAIYFIVLNVISVANNLLCFFKNQLRIF